MVMISGIGNVGTDLDAMTGKQSTFAFFPLIWGRGDGCIIRLVAMINKDRSLRTKRGDAI